ncbi:MAG: fumarylacetoacetate hydrolase family protein [Acetobacteraceae bacterium]|nr:fumarylacetoacetate hydrolase family protein [Acetobacteraceae bacterium]
MPANQQAVVAAFWEARAKGEYFPKHWFGKLTLDEAYHILFGLIARRCEAGERQIGWKVGLTAKAIQQQFGFHEPVFGCILDRTDSGHIFRADELIKPGFEPELCVVLNRDISGKIDVETARAAIGSVHPSLEIIETRGPFTEQIALAMADNAQQKTVVLGAAVPFPVAPEAVEAVVRINGNEVATGRGDAVLGDPLNSVVWLAGKLQEYGRTLKAGELIMTGSFTRQFPITPGDRIRVEFSGVGAVETGMAAG